MRAWGEGHGGVGGRGMGGVGGGGERRRMWVGDYGGCRCVPV